MFVIMFWQIQQDTKVLRVYFKNHYGRKAIVNALQFKEMNSGGGGISLSDNERKALDHTIIPLVTRT
jgi:hypothetical protein